MFRRTDTQLHSSLVQKCNTSYSSSRTRVRENPISSNGLSRRKLIGGGLALAGSLALGLDLIPKQAFATSRTALDTFTYQGSLAASYADQYALGIDNTLSDMSFLHFRGEDCTDFVSCAMVRGGFPMNENWYSFWKPEPYLFGSTNVWVRSNTWINAPDLYDYLINQTSLGSEIGVSSGIQTQSTPSTGLVPGDLIFYDWGDGKGISHAGILTAPGNDAYSGWNGDLVDTHNNDLVQTYWSLEPFNQYSSTTQIHLVHIVYNNAIDISY